MEKVFSLQQPLHSIFWTYAQNQLLRKIFLVVSGCMLLTLAAKISIPMWPVPMGMHTFAVLFIGMTYGWRLGLYTVMSYIALGTIGMPVFTAPIPGYLVLCGPTCGFIVGYGLAVLISGFLAERGWGRNFFTAMLAMLIADIAVFASGLVVLTTFVGWSKAVSLGVVPFLLGDSLKIIALSFIVPRFWSAKA